MLREVRTAWTFCAAVVTIAAKDEGGWQVVLGPLQRVEEVTAAARVDRKVDRTTTTATREVYFILLKLTWYSLESWSFAVVLAAAPVAALFIPEHWALSQRRGGCTSACWQSEHFQEKLHSSCNCRLLCNAAMISTLPVLFWTAWVVP